MKKVLFAIATVALLMGAVSCQQDEFRGAGNFFVKNPLKTIVVTIGNDATRLGLVSGEETATPVFELDDEVFGWDANGKYTYKCTAVNGSEATFTKTSTYAPSADAGTKVNLVFAKGYSASDVADGKLNIDITEQNALTFNELPIVMTASGAVDANGQCKMVFKNETSVINVANCTSTGTEEVTNVYATNLYPTMSFAINADGEFVRTPGKAATICNSITFTPDVENGNAFSFCLATFPTPEGEQPAIVSIYFTSASDYTFFVQAERTIPENMILNITESSFAVAQHMLVETGEMFGVFRDAIDAANAYPGPCTLKVLSDCSSSPDSKYDITNENGVTYDMNGHITKTNKYGRLHPAGEGYLILVDSSEEGTGQITNTYKGYSTFFLDEGYLELRSGMLTQTTSASNLGLVVEVAGNGYFEMMGGTLLGYSRFLVAASGSPMITITGGLLMNASETYDAIQSTADAALMTISGGYFYSPIGDDCHTFSINPNKMTGIDILVSGGYFVQDITELPVVTINNNCKWETCEEEFDGLTYTYRAVKK